MPSCSELLTARKNRVLAVSTVDRKNASCSVYLSREAGERLCGCCKPVTGLEIVYNGIGEYTYTIYWDSVPGAVSYTIDVVKASDTESDIIPNFPRTTTDTEFSFEYANSMYFGTDTYTVTANGCNSSSSVTLFPCFLAGSLVHTADGVKAIEDIQVGDIVVGAFGELNEVLALHRPLLGSAKMCRINDEHSTTNHHPHVSLDKKFYCGDPDLVSSSTYGHMHTVLDAEGKSVERMLYGLKKERIRKLELGVELKTIEGSRTTNSVEVYEMPPETQLYNLVVSGSHTYHVDGYAVTGWPAEHDFDYDNWVKLA
jgi:hypothetical protein